MIGELKLASIKTHHLYLENTKVTSQEYFLHLGLDNFAIVHCCAKGGQPPTSLNTYVHGLTRQTSIG